MSLVPRILTFADYYLPAFKAGGPIRTISRLVDHFSGEFEFLIVTRDRDTGESEPFSGIDRRDWNQVGAAKVRYLAPLELTPLRIVCLLRQTEHDVLYLNSLFSPRLTVLPLLARRMRAAPRRPTVIAPRGECSPSALAIKTLKKRSFKWVARSLDLYQELIWQASSTQEVADIQRAFGQVANEISCTGSIAPDIPRVFRNGGTVDVTQYSGSAGRVLRVVFLSRIAPIKNLLFAIDVLANVSEPVSFTIYGPRDENYWRRCERAIAVLPEHVTVTYGGAIEHDKVIGLLASYDLFFLPTQSENYGHVIAEALAAGLPVLVSDQTPWRDFEHYGIGRVLPLAEKFAFVRYIEELARQNPQARLALRKRVSKHAKTLLDNRASVESVRELFVSALKGRHART